MNISRSHSLLYSSYFVRLSSTLHLCTVVPSITMDLAKFRVSARFSKSMVSFRSDRSCKKWLTDDHILFFHHHDIGQTSRCRYLIYPKYLDRQARANRVDQYQTLQNAGVMRCYTVCHSSSLEILTGNGFVPEAYNSTNGIWSLKWLTGGKVPFHWLADTGVIDIYVFV